MREPVRAGAVLLAATAARITSQKAPECIGPYGREGGKKSSCFSSSKRGHILMGGGVKIFMSHDHFSVPVSTQFVVFLEVLLKKMFNDVKENQDGLTTDPSS